jgi:hypothetical protein
MHLNLAQRSDLYVSLARVLDAIETAFPGGTGAEGVARDLDVLRAHRDALNPGRPRVYARPLEEISADRGRAVSATAAERRAREVFALTIDYPERPDLWRNERIVGWRSLARRLGLAESSVQTFFGKNRGYFTLRRSDRDGAYTIGVERTRLYDDPAPGAGA